MDLLILGFIFAAIICAVNDIMVDEHSAERSRQLLYVIEKKAMQLTQSWHKAAMEATTDNTQSNPGIALCSATGTDAAEKVA